MGSVSPSACRNQQASKRPQARQADILSRLAASAGAQEFIIAPTDWRSVSPERAMEASAKTPFPLGEGSGEGSLDGLHRRRGHGLHRERPGHAHLLAVNERLVVERLLRRVAGMATSTSSWRLRRNCHHSTAKDLAFSGHAASGSRG